MNKKYQKQYDVRSYECDRNKNMRILTLFNILQDMADVDAANRGIGWEFCIKNNMTWFGSAYEIEIDRLPKMHEIITILSWPSAKNKLTAYRDFEVLDKDNKSIIRATSQWVLIDLIKKRPISVEKALEFHKPIEERVINSDFEKIGEITNEEERYKFRVRFDDIDLNKHINNAVYPLWACEAVDADFRLCHSPKKMKINFRKEGYMGEKIEVLTHMENNNSYHSIRTYDSDNIRELARVVVEWQKN